jgi:short-subunit dehydrogenase
MEHIQGKKVLITGATGGIGSAVATLLHQSGAQVFLTGRNSEKLVQVADSIGLSQEHCHVANLANTKEVQDLAERFFLHNTHIDILINTAGIGIIKPFESLTQEDFMESIHSNLLAPFLLLQAFLPHMKKQGKGLIIHIPGVLGKVPMQGAAAYTASKYGLNGMMQSIKEELKRTEIRITNLFLGGTNTPFWDTIDLKVQKEKMVTAQEAARAIWFLCQQPNSGVVNELVLQPFNHQAI